MNITESFPLSECQRKNRFLEKQLPVKNRFLKNMSYFDLFLINAIFTCYGRTPCWAPRNLVISKTESVPLGSMHSSVDRDRWTACPASGTSLAFIRYFSLSFSSSNGICRFMSLFIAAAQIYVSTWDSEV